MSGKKGMKNYPTSIKEQAIRMHFEDGLSRKEITTILGIADEQRVNKWCIIYRREGLIGLQRQSKGRPRKIVQTEQEQLKNEITRLKMENELLRNFLYEAGRR